VKLNLKAAATSLTPKDTHNTPEETLHRVLLVDDEIPNLKGLSRQLADHYDVVCCESAVEALKQIDQDSEFGRFSAIISDQIMPEMSGVEFLRELHKRNHPAPRIMLTGYAALDNVITAVNEASIFRYLTKPVFSEQLMRAVREATNHYEIYRENSRLVGLVKSLMEKNAEQYKTIHSLSPQHNQNTSGHEAFSSKRVPLAILFADIRGFTTLSRTVEPEALIAVLDKIFLPLHEVVYQNGGVVDKHLGDGLMAIFGLSGEFMLSSSLAATEKIAERSRSILETLPAPFDKIKISFGLASGSVVLGIVGSMNRSELTVVGDTVNLASRLQEFSKIALAAPATQNCFLPTDRAMAVCSENLLQFPSKFRKLSLPAEVRIRDFPDVKEVGVLGC